MPFLLKLRQVWAIGYVRVIGAHLSIRKENEGLEDEAGDSTLEDSYA